MTLKVPKDNCELFILKQTVVNLTLKSQANTAIEKFLEFGNSNI